MTPEKKAKELVEKFKDLVATDYQYNDEPILECQKQCAIIAVDEILSFMINVLKWDIKHNGNIEYWHEVKSKLEKQ